MMLRLLPLVAAIVLTSPAVADSFRISGEVTLSDTPADLSGSTVEVTDTGASATTAADGHYELDVEAGTYRLEASRDGYRTAVREGVVVAADTVVSFALSRVFRLSGQVRLADEAAAAGTMVTLSGPEGNRFATTDAAGAFSFEDLVPGEYTLFASRACYLPASAQVTLSGDGSVTLELASNRQAVTGTVRLAGRQGDQSGTSLRLAQGGTAVANGLTDPLGRFRLAGICPGSYELTASRRGYRDATVAVSVNGPSEVPPIELASVGAFTLSGFVRVDGGDASDVTVRLQELAAVAPVQTGADGAYRIEGIPFGTYTLVAAKMGFLEARVPSLVIETDVRLEVRLVRVPPVRQEGAGCTAAGGGASALGLLLSLIFAVAWFRRSRA